MNRTRRVTVTVAAATGLLGAAGAAAVTVAGLAGDTSTHIPIVPSTAIASEPRQVGAAAEQAGAQSRAALQAYVSSMAGQADQLGDRVNAAEVRLTAARAARARLRARVRAHAAAVARAQAAAATSRQQHSPATHTSTGASSAAHGDDEGEGGGDDD